MIGGSLETPYEYLVQDDTLEARIAKKKFEREQRLKKWVSRSKFEGKKLGFI